MRRSLSSKWMCVFGSVFGILATCARAQTPAAVQQIATEDGKQEMIPTRVVEFKAVETDPNLALPTATTDYPHCLQDGSLVLQSVDWQAVMKTPKGKFPKYNDTVTIIRGKKTQTILSTSISDLTDFNALDIFPADSGIYFLLQGSKEQPGERGPGKSPWGIPLKDYRNYVARFDLDGTYKGATELGVACDLSRPGSCELRHLAVFPSGDMLVSESDPETSTLKVLYLNSSGQVVKQIEAPASRKTMDWGDASSNPVVRRAASTFLASVFFTAVGDHIVAWRANSDDPVVEVTQGGGAREVPIQIPKGWRFADMVASNDRWVVHFRTENTPPTVNMSADTDTYFDVRPQDGSLAAKIVQKGDIPLSIACESDGTYTSFKMIEAGKSVLLKGE
ncbi:MAG: hypothetical protein P4L26_10875 [Terracidiphilus sp.]|nr:hypothetical protein [Terracidiphilus sp.]